MSIQRSYALSPEILKLAKQIAKQMYGDENYNLKTIIEYCIAQEHQKMNK